MVFIVKMFRFSSIYPQWFNFVQKTWILPDEQHVWFSEVSKKPNKDRPIYILKSFESKPIEIHCGFKQIESKTNSVVQEYIREPLLFDGFKFGKNNEEKKNFFISIFHRFFSRFSSFCFGHVVRYENLYL